MEHVGHDLDRLAAEFEKTNMNIASAIPYGCVGEDMSYDIRILGH